MINEYATINNGKRVKVEHRSAIGGAGMVTLNGVTTVSFIINPGVPLPLVGDALPIDGQPWRITDVRKSITVRNMIVLTVDEGESDA